MFLFFCALASVSCVINVASAIPAVVNRRWDGGFGETPLPASFGTPCPGPLQSVCTLSKDYFVHLEISFDNPDGFDDVCLGNFADATLSNATQPFLLPEDAVSLYFDASDTLRRFSESSQTALFFFGAAHIRLPVVQFGGVPSGIRHAEHACRASIPLGQRSPLWLFWRNATIAAERIILGGLPSALGELQAMDSPPLHCMGEGPAMCALPGEIEGVGYDVALWSGSSITVAPASLISDLHDLRNAGETHMRVVFTGVPSRLECEARLLRMGAQGLDVCSDAKRKPFEIRIPLEDVLEGSTPNGGFVHIIQEGSDPNTVVLSSRVFDRTRVFFDAKENAVILGNLPHDHGLTNDGIYLFVALSVAWFGQVVAELPRAWPTRRSPVKIGYWEAAAWVLSLAGTLVSYAPYLLFEVRGVFGLQPVWAQALFAGIHIFNGVVAVSIVVYYFYIAVSSGSELVAPSQIPNSYSRPRRSIAQTLAVERAFVALNSSVITCIDIGLLLLAMMTSPGHFGSFFNALIGCFIVFRVQRAPMIALSIENLHVQMARENASVKREIKDGRVFFGLWVAYMILSSVQSLVLTSYLTVLVFGPFFVETLNVGVPLIFAFLTGLLAVNFFLVTYLQRAFDSRLGNLMLSDFTLAKKKK